MHALLIGAGFFKDSSGCRLEKDVHHPSLTVRATPLESNSRCTIAITCFRIPILAQWSKKAFSSFSLKYFAGPLFAPGFTLLYTLSPSVDLGTLYTLLLLEPLLSTASSAFVICSSFQSLYLPYLDCCWIFGNASYKMDEGFCSVGVHQLVVPSVK